MLLSVTKCLVVPSLQLPTIGSQAFPVATAKTWNALPTFNVVSARHPSTHSSVVSKLPFSST